MMIELGLSVDHTAIYYYLPPPTPSSTSTHAARPASSNRVSPLNHHLPRWLALHHPPTKLVVVDQCIGSSVPDLHPQLIRAAAINLTICGSLLPSFEPTEGLDKRFGLCYIITRI